MQRLRPIGTRQVEIIRLFNSECGMCVRLREFVLGVEKALQLVVDHGVVGSGLVPSPLGGVQEELLQRETPGVEIARRRQLCASVR